MPTQTGLSLAMQVQVTRSGSTASMRTFDRWQAAVRGHDARPSLLLVEDGSPDHEALAGLAASRDARVVEWLE